MQKFAIPLLCLFNVLIHLSSISFLEFHRDELLYFSLSNHLDLGYASVPPMISWMALLAKSLFGFSPFAVKIFPALLSGILVYLGSLIAKEFKGGFFAQLLSAIVITCTPLVLRAFILFQPVAFDIFFWTLTFYVLIRFINSKEDKYLYILGLVMGFALLNKYLIIFLFFSLLVIIPFTQHRTLFKNKAFYISLGIALLIFSPNLYWQISNDFPVLTHMAELNENQLENITIGGFLGGQVTMLLLPIVIAIFGIYYLLFKDDTKPFRILGLSCISVLLLLIISKGKDYYSAGIYPMLLAAGSVYISQFIKNRKARIGLALTPILLIIPFVPFGIPLIKPTSLANYFDKLDSIGLEFGRIHEDGQKHLLPQDFADMTGWYTIANLAKEAYDQVEDKSSVAIFGENYGIAGAVTLIGKKWGMPEAISFSDAYGYWIPERFDPDVESFIYINDELGADVEALFDEIKVIGSVTDIYSRQYGVTVYLCSQPNRSFNEFWADLLNSF